jgi:catechol 2,3-dioxygenase-like lactoylglutathione lyase family enzyme
MMAKTVLVSLVGAGLGTLAVAGSPVSPQSAATAKMVAPNAIIHVVADLGRSTAFYRDQVGLVPDTEPAFPAGRSDAMAMLTNTPGASVETATFRVPGSETRLVLLRFAGGAGAAISPQLQDFGQAKTAIRVRDIDAQFARVHTGITGVWTTGGGPVRPEGPQGVNQAVITRDPDGAPLEFVFQTTPPIPDSVPASSNVVGGWASLIVQDLGATIPFYQTHFGFEVRNPGRQASATLLALQGLPAATTTMSTGARVPGTMYTWFLYAYGGIERKAVNARLSQPGTTAISLYVDDVRAMLGALRAAGTVVETAGGQAVNVGGHSRVIVRDPGGLLIELVER